MTTKEADCDLAASNQGLINYCEDDDNIVITNSNGRTRELLLQYKDADSGLDMESAYVNMPCSEEASINEGNSPPETILPLYQNISAGYVNVIAEQKDDGRNDAEHTRCADKMAGISVGSVRDITSMPQTENSLTGKIVIHKHDVEEQICRKERVDEIDTLYSNTSPMFDVGYSRDDDVYIGMNNGGMPEHYSSLIAEDITNFEYMKAQRPIDVTETTSNIKGRIVSCLMKNLEANELIEFISDDEKAQSLLLDITNVCLRANKESNTTRGECSADTFEISGKKDLREVHKEDERNTDPMDIYTLPEQDVKPRVEIPGIASMGCTKDTDRMNKTVEKDIRQRKNGSEYDYAYVTRQCNQLKISKDKNSHMVDTTSMQSHINSIQCCKEPQKERIPQIPRSEGAIELASQNGKNETTLKRGLHCSTSDQIASGASCGSVTSEHGTRSEGIDKAVGRTHHAADVPVAGTKPLSTKTDGHNKVDTNGSDKLINWALQNGFRRVTKAKYNAKADKIYVHSYAEVDDIAVTTTNEHSGFSCNNNLKLKSSIGFLIFITVVSLIFLLVFLTKMK